MPTLREMLSAANSPLSVRLKSTSRKNTMYKTMPYDSVFFDDEDKSKMVQEWTDFTYEAIEAAYGNLLDYPVSSQTRIPVLGQTPTEIFSKEDIDTLGIMWTCNVVRAPLKTAGPHIMDQLGQQGPNDAQMVAKKTSFKHVSMAQVTFNPDWSIKDRQRPYFYAMGDSKLHFKWRSEWLASPAMSDRTIRVERTKPLDQMATYCRYAGTRYGFIITDDELVALRIRRVSNSSNLANDIAEAAVEYKSIKWTAGGPGVLTVNLAIWALGMAGMNDRHRAMENHGRYMVRLTMWEEMPAEGGPRQFRNVISGRIVEVGSLPPSAVFGDDGLSFTDSSSLPVPLPRGSSTSLDTLETTAPKAQPARSES